MTTEGCLFVLRTLQVGSCNTEREALEQAIEAIEKLAEINGEDEENEND